MSDNKLTFGQSLQFKLLWGFAWCIAHTPRWFRYHILQPFIVAILMLLRYRRRVIMDNLSRSYPEKTEKELKRIMYRNYRILAEIVVDTMSLVGITPERGRDMMRFVGVEEHKAKLKGRDWIALASHYGCWEYFPLWCWGDPDVKFMSVYHPLQSAVFEEFYRRMRLFAPGISVVPMQECVRRYLRQRSSGEQTIIGLVADQNPPLRPDSYWFDFLNQETVFFDGAEKLAMRFNLPAYFVNVKRVAPGRYEGTFTEIYDGESELQPNEFTGRYVKALESMINDCPELWMWSHRRWKHKRSHQHILDKS